MPPDVSGVGPNWYLTNAWTGAHNPPGISQQVTQAQQAYSAAELAVTNSVQAYINAKAALMNFLNSQQLATDQSKLTTDEGTLSTDEGTLSGATEQLEADTTTYEGLPPNQQAAYQASTLTPAENAVSADQTTVEGDQGTVSGDKGTILADESTLKGLQSAFKTASIAYNTALTNLQTATTNLINAQDAADSAVDSGTDSLLTGFSTQLQGVMNQQLLLNGTESNNLGSEFSGADGTRIGARENFDTSLANYQSLQEQLLNANNQLTQDGDTLLISQSQVVIDQLQLQADQAQEDIDRGQLTVDQGQLAIDEAILATMTPGSPQYMTQQGVVSQDQTNITNDGTTISGDGTTVMGDQRTLTTDQGTESTDQTNYGTQSETVSGLTPQVATAQSSAQGYLTIYLQAIQTEVGILEQAAQIMEVDPTQYLLALSQAQAAATNAFQNSLSLSQSQDQQELTTLYATYPTNNPIVDAEVNAINALAETGVNILTAPGSTSVPITLTSANLPKLPSGGQLSMLSLMTFIAQVEAMFEELLRELRDSDDRVNEARLGAFGIAGAAQASATSIEAAWADQLQAADNAYNDQVITDNVNNSTTTVNQIGSVLSQINAINTVIQQLNGEINQQNANGIQTVTDMNTSIQITTDQQKLQLWSDLGQLSILGTNFNNDVSALQDTDPTKAPLQAVYTALQQVFTDLNNISEDLSSEPVNTTQLAIDQGQLTNTDMPALSTAISNLPSGVSSTISADIVSIDQAITTVTNDQSELQSSQAVDATDVTTALSAQFSGLNTTLGSYQTQLAGDIMFNDVQGFTQLSGSFLGDIESLSSSNTNVPGLMIAYNQTQTVLSNLETVITDYSTVPFNQSKTSGDVHTLQSSLGTLSGMISVLSGRNLPASLMTDFTNLTNSISGIQSDLGTVQDISTTMAAVINQLSVINLDINATPMNPNTVAGDQTLLTSIYLPNLYTAISQVPLSSAAVENDYSNVQQAIAEIGTASDSLTEYLNSPTASASTPPSLPNQAQTPQLPAPIQIPQLQQLSLYTIPAAFPLQGYLTPPPPVASQDVPTLPTDAEVESLNNIVESINQIITPILPSLQAAGINVTPITPLYVRQYVPVRTPDAYSDEGILGITNAVINALINAILNDRYELSTNGALGSEGFITAILTPSAATAITDNTGGVVSTGTLGADTGMSSVNYFSGTGNVGATLNSLLGSSGFSTYLSSVVGNSTVIGALNALNIPPGSTLPYSSLGMVNEDSTSSATSPTALTPAEQAAAAGAVTELVTYANNTPAILAAGEALLQQLGPQNLTNDQINELLSIIVFLVQLIALLLAALISAAAGGSTNIDTIVQNAFPTSAGGTGSNITQTAGTLQALGVQGLPAANIAPTNPAYFPAFINAVNPELTPAQQAGFAAQVTNIFSANGVTLNSNEPLGTAVQQGFAAATPAEQAAILPELTSAATNAGNQAVVNVAGNVVLTPTASTAANQGSPPSRPAPRALGAQTPAPHVAATPTVTALAPGAPPTAAPAGIAAAPPTAPPAGTALAPGAPPPAAPAGTPATPPTLAPAPQTSPISPQTSNILTSAVINGTITPLQATGVVNNGLVVSATQTNPPIGALYSTSVQTPGTTPATYSGTAGQLPDSHGQVVSGLQAASNQTTNTTFVQQAASSFADSVRGQSDYFTKSLSLVLGPAQTYVKNFSVVTRDNQLPSSIQPITQIPISG